MNLSAHASSRQKRSVFSFVLAGALAFAGAAAANEQWIHVKVQEGDKGEEVTVNLPVSLLSAAAAFIPENVQGDAKVTIEDMEMDWQDLQALWQEVKKAPEATFVTVESQDETVEVKKEGDFLLVKTSELKGENAADVNVTFPLAVVDALLSGPENTFNFEAALRALAAYGPGNLVTVRDGESHVRIWIDDRNTAE